MQEEEGGYIKEDHINKSFPILNGHPIKLYQKKRPKVHGKKKSFFGWDEWDMKI